MTTVDDLRGMWLTRVIDDISNAVIAAARDGMDFCVCVVKRVPTRPLPSSETLRVLLQLRFPDVFVYCGLPAPEGITVTIKWSYS